DDLDGRPARPLSRKFRNRKTDHAEYTVALSLCDPDREPRVPARPPHHGANTVELVPALRSQPANVCPEHLLGQARRLSQSNPARLSHSGRSQTRELHRAAIGDRTLRRHFELRIPDLIPAEI